MSDLTPDPQTVLDELASAYLDGEATPDEARRVLGDPALLARVERLRAVRGALRAPGPPADAGRRDAAIAAALAAIPAPPAIDEVGAARARRARPRWLPAAGIAAAIAAALLLVVPQLDRGSDPHDTLASGATAEDRDATSSEILTQPDAAGDDDTRIEAGAPTADGEQPTSTPDLPTGAGGTTTGGAAPGPTGSTGTGPAASEAPSPEPRPASDPSTTTTASAFEGGDSALATSSSSPVLDLGSFADKSAFTAAADAAASDPGARARASADERAEVDACIASMRADAEGDGGKVLYAAVAEIDGQPAVALAVDHGDWRLVRARHRGDCGVWFARTLSSG